MQRLRVPVLVVALLALGATPSFASGHHRGKRPRWTGSSTSSSSTRRTTPSTTSTAAGRASRPRRAPTPRTRRRSTRPARRTSCLLQNDVNLDLAAARPARCTDRRDNAVREPLPERAVHDRRLHRADRHDLPARRASSRRTACSTGSGAAGRLHARPRAPLLPGAVPARRRQRRTATSPARDAVGLTMGTYDTQQAADLRVPARAPGTRTTRSPTASSRRRSAARSSTTSGSSPPRRRRSRRGRRRRATTCTRWSTRTGCRRPTRSTRRPATVQGRAR